jgi:hypothetical protein
MQGAVAEAQTGSAEGGNPIDALPVRNRQIGRLPGTVCKQQGNL